MSSSLGGLPAHCSYSHPLALLAVSTALVTQQGLSPRGEVLNQESGALVQLWSCDFIS